MLSLSNLLAVAVALTLAHHAGAAAPTAQQQATVPPIACGEARVALERGKAAEAKKRYDELRSDPATQACAIAGLALIATETWAEERLCNQAAALTAADLKAANKLYAVALARSGTSGCANTALADAATKQAKAAAKKTADDKIAEATKKKEEEEKEDKGWVEEASTWATNALKLVGSLAIAALVLFAVILVGLLMFRRGRSSLTIEPFVDGAAEPKVGAAVAALVEKRLTDVSRRSRPHDAFRLDVIAADIELLASNKSLEGALGKLAEASQLSLLVGVLSLGERMFGNHLVAKGELAPPGVQGRGVLVSLQSEKHGLQGRGELWNRRWSSGAKDNPTAFYELADSAAAWIQYEAALALDSRVALMTSDPKSFSLLSVGLNEHRKGRVEIAAERYAEALKTDRENVGALFNLGALLLRGSHPDGLKLVVRAMLILDRRYEEMEWG